MGSEMCIRDRARGVSVFKILNYDTRRSLEPQLPLVAPALSWAVKHCSPRFLPTPTRALVVHDPVPLHRAELFRYRITPTTESVDGVISNQKMLSLVLE